jgi:coproporphyrinogen III oxidase-like Fe-S oxidoreductase
MNVAALIAKYDRRVPRYRSYPTAPHFSPAVTAADYAGWLGMLEDDAALSLYLHMPFCARLCWFCACHTSVVHRLEPLENYGKTLLTELQLVAAAIGRRLKVRHIHWGGGTPTALPPALMRGVMQSLRAHFDVAPDAEIAVEVDPRELSDASLRVLGEIGTTRASLGVQDFDPQVQQAVNRVQDFALTAACAERLRDVGLDHFARPSDALATATAADRLKRNFQGYTTDDAPVLLGFGASSIGSLPQGYVQNLPSIPVWRDAVRAGRLPVARGIALTDADRLRRAVIETLMCRNAVDLREVAARHDADPASLMDAAPVLQEMACDGLLRWDGMHVAVTPAGRPFVRAVAAAFDTYLAAGAARHSAVV